MTQDPKIYAAGHRGMLGSAIVSHLLTQGQPAARAVTRKITQGLADIAQGLKSTLYIGNLSFFTTEEQIHEAFSKCGEVKRVIMGLDRNKRTPCGFAFVEYARIQ